MNLSAYVTDLIAASSSHWWAYAGGLLINCGITAAIAYHYGAMVGRLEVRVDSVEETLTGGLKLKGWDREEVSDLRSEISSISSFAADLQCDLDSMRETLTSQIVSKVLVSQEVVVARMKEALGPIDSWRAKNDLEFTRLLENWDELRRFTEDELIGIKAQSANCFERIDKCKEAIVSANKAVHRLQQEAINDNIDLNERISAFQAEDKSRDQKPRAKAKPKKAKAKKHG